MDIVQIITEIGSTLGLAVFAIWMLREQMQRQIDDQKERVEEERQVAEAAREKRASERSELVRVIERNSELWQKATSTMAEMATAMAIVSSTIMANEDHVLAIREMLASRPCILRDPPPAPPGGPGGENARSTSGGPGGGNARSTSGGPGGDYTYDVSGAESRFRGAGNPAPAASESALRDAR